MAFTPDDEALAIFTQTVGSEVNSLQFAENSRPKSGDRALMRGVNPTQVLEQKKRVEGVGVANVAPTSQTPYVEQTPTGIPQYVEQTPTGIPQYIEQLPSNVPSQAQYNPANPSLPQHQFNINEYEAMKALYETVCMRLETNTRVLNLVLKQLGKPQK